MQVSPTHEYLPRAAEAMSLALKQRAKAKKPPNPGLNGLSPRLIADRILTTALNTDGPLVINVSGTRGTSYEHAGMETLKYVGKIHGGQITAVSIPYDNSISSNFKRFFGFDSTGRDQVLQMVLRGIAKMQPNRKVYVVGESQGSWVVSNVLKNDPLAAKAVTRAVLFSTPGVAPRQDALNGAEKVLSIRHREDIVTGLITHLTKEQVTTYAETFKQWITGRLPEMHPHVYTPDAAAAAMWLMRGTTPNRPTHSAFSHEDRTH